MNPQFPLYIVSKGRADTRLTSKALERMNVPYHIVVEASEYDAYTAVIDPAKVMILDESYKDSYELLDDLGRTKSTGAGPARNFCWDHSISQGYEWHWVMDDNIRGFWRRNRNRRMRLGDGTMFRACEDWVLRYKNIAMAGPQYEMFAPRRERLPVFTPNTRIYSCNLIRNDVPFRWRGRYNEDTILSLDMLKAGWCTVLWYAFLQEKIRTQLIPGGNTSELYGPDGSTGPKTQMLINTHPDVCRVMKRYGRIHHLADYRPFKRNRLKRKLGIEIPKGVDEYGLVEKERT